MQFSTVIGLYCVCEIVNVYKEKQQIVGLSTWGLEEQQ